MRLLNSYNRAQELAGAGVKVCTIFDLTPLTGSGWLDSLSDTLQKYAARINIYKLKLDFWIQIYSEKNHTQERESCVQSGKVCLRSRFWMNIH